MTETRSCPICGEPMAPSRTRPRIFCSPAHRQAGYDLEQRRFSSPSGPLRLRSRPTRPQARWEAVRARGKRPRREPAQAMHPNRLGRLLRWRQGRRWSKSVRGGGGKAWARVPTSLRLAYTDPTYQRNRKLAFEREPECHWRFWGCTRISTRRTT